MILHSLALLRDAGWKDYSRLTVLINPDEEIGSNGSGEAIAALGDAHDVVLSYEPTAAKAVAQGRRRAADGRRHGQRCAWASRARRRTPVPRPTRAATR